MLAFINANVADTGFLAFLMIGACVVLVWALLTQSRGHQPATIKYRGLRLAVHPSVPTGKIVVLDPQGYTLSEMTMQALDGLSRRSGRAVLLSRDDFNALCTRVRGLAWRAAARDIASI